MRKRTGESSLCARIRAAPIHTVAISESPGAFATILSCFASDICRTAFGSCIFILNIIFHNSQVASRKCCGKSCSHSCICILYNNLLGLFLWCRLILGTCCGLFKNSFRCVLLSRTNIIKCYSKLIHKLECCII